MAKSATTTIHHATMKRAEAAGVILSMVNGRVVGINHQYGIKIEGKPGEPAGAVLDAVIAEKEARQTREYNNEDINEDVEDVEDVEETGDLEDQLEVALDRAFPDTVPATLVTPEGDTITHHVVERINGISVNGAIAYSEGTLTADCPFDNESEDEAIREAAEKWYEDWDKAADEAEEAEEKVGGSVVSAHFRAKYAEEGHPNNCGDWLTNVITGLIGRGDAGTDVELLDKIAVENGIDLSKYNRTRHGWCGRLVMTHNNILRPRICKSGIIRLPGPGGFEDTVVPEDWRTEYLAKKKESNNKSKAKREAKK